MSMFEACYDCEAKAGAETIETLQESVNCTPQHSCFGPLTDDESHSVRVFVCGRRPPSEEHHRGCQEQQWGTYACGSGDGRFPGGRTGYNVARSVIVSLSGLYFSNPELNTEVATAI
jgi:hypothetical protein